MTLILDVNVAVKWVVNESESSEAKLLPVNRIQEPLIAPVTNVIDHAVDLSVSLHHSVYDCIDLATALFKQCKLITADQQFVDNLANIVCINHVEVL